ncbi:Endochitinase 1 [Linnemannia hyalina]|uniref:Endochitinase 1 n=1 Tax=Linnemannia hyalina TaxID=64524 RepID=A0A9P7XNU6_9FUNG|nr:Endochitinase 1 [Linnemannia hyalina]
MRLPAVLACLALVLSTVTVGAQRVVGYYGKTAGQCPDYPSFAPAKLPYELYTHLNFAFVMINDDGVVEMQHPEDEALYKELNALKLKKPSLKTTLTVGGWDMDMAHYSTMVSTPANRQKFIQSAMTYVRKYGFDGMDFDWDPSDKLRGGHSNDPENFVAFLKEMREAANKEKLKEGQERMILSIALPGGPFHGQYFNIPKLAQHVDWFNIMAYNLHGQWEDMVYCAAPLYDTAAHTKYNGYSVDNATKAMVPKSVSPMKFNLGLSLSGVTFTLKDKKKTSPGSPAQGPGREGCQEKGAMAYFEARKLADSLQIADVKSRAPDHFHRTVTQEPKMDPVGKCMYMVVNEDQWVGYDNPETFAMKMEYLSEVGFGGVSIWSMDSDSANHELTKSIHSSLSENFIQGAGLSKAGSGLATLDEGEQETTNGAASAKTIAGCAVKVMAAVALSIMLLA